MKIRMQGDGKVQILLAPVEHQTLIYVLNNASANIASRDKYDGSDRRAATLIKNLLGRLP